MIEYLAQYGISIYDVVSVIGIITMVISMIVFLKGYFSSNKD